MARIHQFRPKTTEESEAAKALAEAQALIRKAAELGTDRERRTAERMLTAAKPRRGGFMRVWIEREAEIDEELAARAETRRAAGKPADASAANCTRILRYACRYLPDDGQRLTRTQAELGAELGLTAAMISAAMSELRAVKAILAPERKGKSQTWEIDAEYCSRLNDIDREKAIRAQTLARQREATDPRKQARLDAAARRLGADPGNVVDLPIYDARQTELPDD